MRRVTGDELRAAMKRGITLVAVTHHDKEDEPKNRDEMFALALVNGFYTRTPDGKVSHQFLSADTYPTEQEARLAVARILLSGRPPYWLLKGLAGLFAPDPEQPGRTVVIKNATKSRANLRMSHFIAMQVESCRSDGCSYEEATARVAEKQGRDLQHVQKIYARWVSIARQLGLPSVREIKLSDVAFDKRTSAVASDH